MSPSSSELAAWLAALRRKPADFESVWWEGGVMAKKRSAEPEKSADELYQEARDRWVKAVDLGVHDDERVIYGVTPILERALRQSPQHIKSLALLSDLLMQMGADEEASRLLAKLRQLEPDAKAHQEKADLLQKKQSKERRGEIRHYLAMKWLTTQDW
jgi:hypothetical protein